MLDKMGVAFEQPLVFGFFLFLFIVGLSMAMRIVGHSIRPATGSLADALQSQ